MNRFGHSISYDRINATETTSAEEQLNNENARVDMCQTTFNLACSLQCHGTSGIVIQASKHVFNGIVSHTSEPSTSRPCSFKVVLQELQPYIKTKHRPNPLPIHNLENDANQLDGFISEHEDIVWSILRHKSGGEKQVIPA